MWGCILSLFGERRLLFLAKMIVYGPQVGHFSVVPLLNAVNFCCFFTICGPPVDLFNNIVTHMPAL